MVHVSQPVSARITEAFIKRDPVVVAPLHRRLQPTENGGKRWVLGDTGPNETVRFVPTTTTTEQHAVRTTPDGRTVNPQWNMICLPGSLVERGDLIPWGTKTLEIIYKAESPSWRVVFEAIEYDDA